MESKGSLLCSYSLMLTQIHSHMDPVPSLTFYMSKIHFTITLTSTLWSLRWLLPVFQEYFGICGAKHFADIKGPNYRRFTKSWKISGSNILNTVCE